MANDYSRGESVLGLTRKELASVLGVHYATIKRWQVEGRIKASYKFKREYRYKLEEVLQALKAHSDV